jgi:hypothetical protein
MSLFTFKREVKLVDQQISVWIARENRDNPNGTYQTHYESWARKFIDFIRKDDICDVEPDDVESFLHHVASTINGRYQLIVARKAVNAIRRFYTARGKKMVKIY